MSGQNASAEHSENRLSLADFSSAIRFPLPLNLDGKPFETLVEVRDFFDAKVVNVILFRKLRDSSGNAMYQDNSAFQAAHQLLWDVYRVLEHLGEEGFPRPEIGSPHPASLSDLEGLIDKLAIWFADRLVVGKQPAAPERATANKGGAPRKWDQLARFDIDYKASHPEASDRDVCSAYRRKYARWARDNPGLPTAETLKSARQYRKE